MYLIFEKSSWKKVISTNWNFSLQKSNSELIFAGNTCSKNPVQKRLKSSLSNLIFQKSSTDQQGVQAVYKEGFKSQCYIE
jgi:hypothetical protein